MNPYEAIFQNTLDGNEQGVLAACRELLDEGYRPIDILEQGMIPAMDRLGELLSRGERFVPQVLISAKAMQSAVSFLQPILLEQGYEFVTLSEMFGFDPPETSDELYVYDRANYEKE